MVQTTSGTNNSADVQISLSNYDDGYATVRRAVSMVTGQLDFKIELQSSLATMVGGMPTGSRGVVMSPNAHDGSSHTPTRRQQCMTTRSDINVSNDLTSFADIDERSLS